MASKLSLKQKLSLKLLDVVPSDDDFPDEPVAPDLLDASVVPDLPGYTVLARDYSGENPYQPEEEPSDQINRTI